MPTIPAILVILAATAAANATSPCPKYTAKDRLLQCIESLGVFFSSNMQATMTKTTSSVENWSYHDVLDSRPLSDAISDRRLLSDYILSLHAFLPTMLPLMDDMSKNVFERAALEFIVSNIDDENLHIESVRNLQITDQELEWQRIFDGRTTPGINVFFRAEVAVSGDLTHNEIEQSIQFMFNSKSTTFHSMFEDAKGSSVDGPSLTAMPAPSVGLANPLTMPPSTQPSGPSRQPPTLAQSVQPPGPSTGPPSFSNQPSVPLAISSEQSTGTARTASTLLTVVVTSTVMGSASLFVVLLLFARYVRKINDRHDDKVPLETTMECEEKDENNRSEASFMHEDEQLSYPGQYQTHLTAQLDGGTTVSDEEGQVDSLQYITASTIAKDFVDLRMFFECDESAIRSSIASSTISDDSLDFSQKSTVTLEDLDNFERELRERQLEC